MKRTQLITLLLVLFTGIGFASAKPKVAVLGLEVLDKTNAKASLDAARQLTEGLRLAARAAGPFDVADNSQREFLDEKIINQCESEQRDCLIKIAGNFGATSLVYGKLQLADNKKNFQVTVFLLTADKGAAKPAVTSVPVSASPQDLQAAGKKIYNELVGVSSPGSIVIKAKTSRGSVYINNDLRGQLVDGELKATQLADGEYRVRVTADGFKRWEETVRIKNGQTVTLEPKLEAEAAVKPPVADPEDKASRPVAEDPYKLETRENTVSKSSGRRGWKIAAVGGAVVAVGSMGVWAWQFNERGKAEDELKDNGGGYGSGGGFFGGDCDLSETTDTNRPIQQGACDNVRNMWIAGSIAGAAGIFTGVALYMGYVRNDEANESPPSASTKRARKPRFAVTPIISPEGGGASFRLDF